MKNFASATAHRISAGAAIAAGVLFLVIQVLHPAQTLEAAVSLQWALVHALTLAMAVLGLIGLSGLWSVQRQATGWLGLVGLVLFAGWLLLTFALVFVEFAVLPAMAVRDPSWALAVLGLTEGVPSPIELGVLSPVASVAGGFYLLGGLLFGVATFRAKVLSKTAGLVFGLGAASAVLFAFLPHSVERLAAVPVAVGWILLGVSLWRQRTTS